MEMSILPKRFYCENDVMIWMGDLNYRLELNDTPSAIVELLQNDAASLLSHDQLSMVRQSGGAFSVMEEASVHFPPTYKYKKGTSEFNLKRHPAWCDRILYRGNWEVDHYDAIMETSCSDHKPVVMTGTMAVKRYKDEELRAVREDVKREVENAEHGVPQISPSRDCVDFGVVKLGEPHCERVELANEGTANAYFSVWSSDFVRVSPQRGLVPPGERCTLEVQFVIRGREARRWRRSHCGLRWSDWEATDEVAIEVLDQPEVAIQWRAAWKTPSLLSVFSDLFTRNGWLLFKCAAVFFVLDCFQHYSRVCRKHPKQLIL